LPLPPRPIPPFSRVAFYGFVLNAGQLNRCGIAGVRLQKRAIVLIALAIAAVIIVAGLWASSAPKQAEATMAEKVSVRSGDFNETGYSWYEGQRTKDFPNSAVNISSQFFTQLTRSNNSRYLLHIYVFVDVFNSTQDCEDYYSSSCARFLQDTANTTILDLGDGGLITRTTMSNGTCLLAFKFQNIFVGLDFYTTLWGHEPWEYGPLSEEAQAIANVQLQKIVRVLAQESS